MEKNDNKQTTPKKIDILYYKDFTEPNSKVSVAFRTEEISYMKLKPFTDEKQQLFFYLRNGVKVDIPLVMGMDVKIEELIEMFMDKGKNA